MLLRRFWPWLLLASPLACTPAEDGVRIPALELSWQPCHFVTQACELTEAGCPGPQTYDAECARVQVPAHYAAPEQGELQVAVKRRRATSPRRGQLWLLMGGPGGSVTRFASVQRYARHADLDLYLMDHRGVGLSTRLGCPEQEADGSPGGYGITLAEAEACVAHLESEHGSLTPFNPTDAAYDLVAMIQATATESDQAFLYGVSYGTYWLHRYAQLSPERASGLIFDSTCAPGDCRLETYDLGYDETGKGVLADCAADPDCAVHLPDAPAQLRALYDEVALGHCSAVTGGSVAAVQLSLSRLLEVRDFHALIPALVYRLRRCSPDDVTALQHFASVIGPVYEPPPLWKQVESIDTLGTYIVLSELWTLPDATTRAQIDGALFSAHMLEKLEPLRALWPRYIPPALAGSLSSRQGPVLMLHGTRDPQTPLRMAQALRDRFSGPNQTFVVIPHASHNVVASSATVASESCGGDLLEQFTGDPTVALDTACVDALTPPAFEGTPGLATAVFGTADFWD